VGLGRLDAGMGLNPAQGVDVCPRLSVLKLNTPAVKATINFINYKG
jgi:hypothetical protein